MKTDIFLNRKSEADKHVLEIDPVTAPVVRHIFDLRLQGYGFRKIALQLNAEKVPAPRSFYYMAEGRENLRGETPFWNDMTVKTILRNEVYIGHMVQNKTGTVSYKNHKQVSKPESEWIKVENTHEPLISQETWDAVQRMDNHPVRGRSGKSGTIALFGGLLRCMDCGSSMWYMRDYRKKVSEKEPEYRAYVCNRYASGGKRSANAIPWTITRNGTFTSTTISSVISKHKPSFFIRGRLTIILIILNLSILYLFII